MEHSILRTGTFHAKRSRRKNLPVRFIVGDTVDADACWKLKTWPEKTVLLRKNNWLIECNPLPANESNCLANYEPSARSSKQMKPLRNCAHICSRLRCSFPRRLRKRKNKIDGQSIALVDASRWRPWACNKSLTTQTLKLIIHNDAEKSTFGWSSEAWSKDRQVSVFNRACEFDSRTTIS